MKPSLNDLLAVALEAAHLGGERTLKYFNQGVAVELKGDNTPVTRADRESEELIRERILRAFPTHSIVGEEGGATKGDDSFKWILDPIDGTKAFIHGVPFYGVLIGVEVEGRPSVGVVHMPALHETVSAVTGGGCLWNGKPCRVSGVSRLGEATLLTSSVTSCMARSDAYERLAAGTLLQRTWGDCYGYVLVATGRAEIMLDPRMNPWDCAPFLPILQEAGGHFTDWRGKATIWSSDSVGTNAALHAQVLDILKTERKKTSGS